MCPKHMAHWQEPDKQGGRSRGHSTKLFASLELGMAGPGGVTAGQPRVHMASNLGLQAHGKGVREPKATVRSSNLH